MVPRWLVWPLFALVMGFFIGGSVFWGFFGPNVLSSGTIQPAPFAAQSAEPNSHKDVDPNSHKERTDDLIMVFTAVLAFATIGLGVATVLLFWTGERQLRVIHQFAVEQAKDTRIMQRAYISVIPRGIAPYLSSKLRLACEVSFYNAGNLPAREVSWSIQIRLSHDPSENDFSAPGPFYGNNIIPPKSDMRKGAPGVEAKFVEDFVAGGQLHDRWLYVWGEVRYRDGFGVPRFTSFCHRYNLLGAVDNTVPGENGRYHEYGNHTDEESGLDLPTVKFTY